MNAENKKSSFPVWTEESAHVFVAVNKIPPRRIVEGGKEFLTAPLKAGKLLALLSVGNNSGYQVSALDPAVRLKTFYLEIGGEVWSFDVAALVGSDFAYTAAGRCGEFNLKAEYTLTEKITTADGKSYTLVFKVEADGRVNTETSGIEVYFKTPCLVKITEADDSVCLNDEFVASVSTMFASSSIIGYDVDFREIDVNSLGKKE